MAAFHTVIGRNLSLDPTRKQVTWSPQESGGCLFLKQSLARRDHVAIKVTGSGCVELGVIPKNPSEFRNGVPLSASNCHGYVFLNDVKLHKRSCLIDVWLDDSGSQVSTKYGDAMYSYQIVSHLRYWLVLDVKYGNVDVALQNTENSNNVPVFSDVHGQNIQILNEPNCARSLTRSPASFCFVDTPLTTETRVALKCTTCPQRGTIPGRYYLTLRLIAIDPETFRRIHTSYLDPDCPPGREPSWQFLETFEKEECAGEVAVVFHDNKVMYKSASGKINTQILKNWDASHQEAWLVMELYGVSMQIQSRRGEAFAFAERYLEPVSEGGLGARSSSSARNTSFLSEQGETSDTGDQSKSRGTTPDQGAQDMIRLHGSIQENFIAILDDLYPVDFCDYLFQGGVITRTACDELQVKAKTSTREANRELLLKYLSIKPVNKTVLISALESSGNGHLVERFVSEKD